MAEKTHPEWADPGPDDRLFASAVSRNREPILAVLARVLPAAGTVLEIASGSGEHAVFFAGSLPHLTWRPSDPDPRCRTSIAAHAAAAGLANLESPRALDVTAPDWPRVAGLDRADAPRTRAPESPVPDSPAAPKPPTAIVCINMLHIAPWSAAEGLLAGAARLLPAGGPLVLYGPYRRGGAHTAPSNAAFDEDLRRRNPAWGVRDLEAVERTGAARGLALDEVVEMPANNLTLVLRRRPA